MKSETQVSDVAERLRSHVETLANTPMTIALDQWSAISNGILNSADLIERQQKEIAELQSLRSKVDGLVDTRAKQHNEITRLTQDLKEARGRAIDECAKVAEQKAQDFLSPEYATGQPLSSFNERFACGEIAKAIKALKGEQT